MVHKLVSSNLCTIFVLILSPRLNADFIELHGAERLDEGAQYGSEIVGKQTPIVVFLVNSIQISLFLALFYGYYIIY